MPPVRPNSDAPGGRWLWLGLVGLVCFSTVGLFPPGAAGAPTVTVSGTSAFDGANTAVSIVALGPSPSELTAGWPTLFAWQAVDAQGSRVSSFAAAAELTVAESGNGSLAPAWVNASVTGPLVRSGNGTFTVPAAAWSGGALNLTVDPATAAPVRVDLFGPGLPSEPEAIPLTVLPDLDHLELYDAVQVANNLSAAGRSYSAFWHVRDRFGDPVPGAVLFVACVTGDFVHQTAVPVVWSAGGSTGAWVNVTVPGTSAASVTVLDGAGAPVLGPLSVPAVPAAAPTSSPSLAPLALLAVALLAVGGVGGVGVLLIGGRPRTAASPSGEEGELRRLAEGRATVVEIVRAQGPVALGEIEAAWEPPPAPPALADWVASLVTDGTLTAALDARGTAKFALAERRADEPRVTLDAEALAKGIARRDAAIEPDDAEDAPR